MQVLIDEDNRALGVAPDGMDWFYPDKRWKVLKGLPDDESKVFIGGHDYISYVWDGKTFNYDPKNYEE